MIAVIYVGMGVYGGVIMPIWKGIVLGIIQGFAEFLPISSSGHLIIIKEALGVDLGEGGMFFDVMLHFGTLLAIFVAFFSDIRKLFVEGIHIIVDSFANVAIFFKRLAHHDIHFRRVVRTSYRKYVMLIIVSTIPTGIIGILFSDIVEQANNLVIVPGICLFFTAVFLLIADFADLGSKRPKDVKYSQAAYIGVAQGIATMPGVSRSGTTITACLLCGFDKKFALRYSFIMSIPAVLGAVVLEIKDFEPAMVSKGDIPACIIATAVSAVTGYIAIKWMLALMRGRKYRYFAIYCAIAGAVAIGLYFMK